MTECDNRKFAILSHILPPSSSGQAVMLYRLLADVSPKDYVLLDSGVPQAASATQSLPGRYYQLKRQRLFPLMKWKPLQGPWEWSVRRKIEARAREIGQILLAEGCSLLVACSGDLTDLPAGALAARRAGVKFVPYLFDDYLYQWTGWRRELARLFESDAMQVAQLAIVPNEFLAKEYEARYGISCHIVRNPLPFEEVENPPVERACGSQGELRILYTGSVYHAQLDAFLRLIQTLETLGGGARLCIYTSQPAEDLKRQGICGPYVTIRRHVDQQTARRLQHEADLLFLPLAFSSEIPEVIRTSAPGKMGEYLASGTPILAHAPADSYLSWFFREHRCGTIVDGPDVSALARALSDFSDNRSRWREAAERGRTLSAAEFGIAKQRERFTLALRQATIEGGRDA